MKYLSHLCRAAVAGAAVVTLITAHAVEAAAPTDQLRQHVDRVLKVLEDPAMKQAADRRAAAIRKIATEIFDFEEAAKRSLGPHWQARTPAERQEFVGLLTDLLERSYIGKIDLYQGEKIVYAGDAVEGDQATVRTKIVSKQGTEIPINYRMHQKDGRWLVYDVSIEGVSLVANYRSQFNRIIQSGSWQDLVTRLRAKETPAPRDRS
ncbi:MAG: MlaC/ttg2D family ABC transporter substrate-binding protein [Candidatus Rokuibacteriota bacterium]